MPTQKVHHTCGHTIIKINRIRTDYDSPVVCGTCVLKLAAAKVHAFTYHLPLLAGSDFEVK